MYVYYRLRCNISMCPNRCWTLFYAALINFDLESQNDPDVNSIDHPYGDFMSYSLATSRLRRYTCMAIQVSSTTLVNVSDTAFLKKPLLSTNARPLLLYLSKSYTSLSLRTINGRNNLTPSKSRNHTSKLILYTLITFDSSTLSLWILTSQSSGKTINIYDTSHHFAANRRTDLHGSWFFSSRSLRFHVCFINCEVAAKGKKPLQVHSSLFPKVWFGGSCGSDSYRSFPFSLTGMVRVLNRTLLAFHFITGLAATRLYLLSISFTMYPLTDF